MNGKLIKARERLEEGPAFKKPSDKRKSNGKEQNECVSV